MPCRISNASGVNAVDLGKAIDIRLDELIEDLPVGIEIHRISLQSDLVDASIDAFYPIAASNELAGEYCATLFSVVAIALMISWLFAVTITPLMCIGLIKIPKNAPPAGEEYSGKLLCWLGGKFR
ncbi:MAG: hypothetical protein V3V05_11265 [Pontiella sp.]